jgi:glycosyltransferase involved in cell wall biosynthesis
MTMNDCFVSVIIPLYNHSKIIAKLLEEITIILQENYHNYEIVLVNDGSEDNTLKTLDLLLKEYRCIRLINLSRHFGTEIAISAGLDSVIGDFIVTMIPDSDPPQLIPELIEESRKGKDILMGIRKNRNGEPLWRRIGANIFYWCCRVLFKIPLTKNVTLFTVLSRQVVNTLIQVDDKYAYLRLLSAYVGFKNETFVYEPIKRMKKNRNLGLIESISLGLQIIFINSVHPLRLASYCSLLGSIFNLIYMLYIVGIYLFKNKVAEGWVTLSMQNAIMFFLISIILAILCEYIGIMFTKSRGWSSYYIANEKNSSMLLVNPEKPNITHNSEDFKV